MKQDLNGVRTPEDVVRRFDLGEIPLLVKSQKEITLEVSKKVGDDEIISKINLTPEQATINADKISLEGKNIDLTGQNIAITSDNFSVDNEGNMTCNDATMSNVSINEGTLEMTHPNGSVVNIGAFEGIVIEDNSLAPELEPYSQITATEIVFHDDDSNFVRGYYGANYMVYVGDDHLTDNVYIDGSTGNIDIIGTLTSANGVCQGSKEEIKKDFEKLESGLDIVKNTDIYKYHLKEEKETDKKHIGFVIGDKYNYRKEITSKDNDGVDLYSMVSVLWRAVQEQQAEIERLKEVKNDSD